MKIHAVNDSDLVQSKSEFTVSHDSNGWSANGIMVNGNAAALQEAFGTRNMQVGSSPLHRRLRDHMVNPPDAWMGGLSSRTAFT